MTGKTYAVAILAVVLSAVVTSAWWALFVFGWPNNVGGVATVNGHMVPVAVLAGLGIVGMLVFLIVGALTLDDV